MNSLEQNFQTLVARIRRGRDFDDAAFDPVYYLVFPVAKILEVKRTMSAWLAKLKHEGWKPETFSIAENVAAILNGSKARKIWLMGDRKSPLDWARTNQSLEKALSGGALMSRIEAKLAEMETKKDALLIVTDLEALHPYMRIGAIESALYGKFKVPTVFLYPGERVGSTKLKFLGFYPEDGNYRSVHIGG